MDKPANDPPGNPAQGDPQKPTQVVEQTSLSVDELKDVKLTSPQEFVDLFMQYLASGFTGRGTISSKEVSDVVVYITAPLTGGIPSRVAFEFEFDCVGDDDKTFVDWESNVAPLVEKLYESTNQAHVFFGMIGGNNAKVLGDISTFMKFLSDHATSRTLPVDINLFMGSHYDPWLRALGALGTLIPDEDRAGSDYYHWRVFSPTTVSVWDAGVIFTNGGVDEKEDVGRPDYFEVIVGFATKESSAHTAPGLKEDGSPFHLSTFSHAALPRLLLDLRALRLFTNYRDRALAKGIITRLIERYVGEFVKCLDNPALREWPKSGDQLIDPSLALGGGVSCPLFEYDLDKLFMSDGESHYSIAINPELHKGSFDNLAVVRRVSNPGAGSPFEGSGFELLPKRETNPIAKAAKAEGGEPVTVPTAIPAREPKPIAAESEPRDYLARANFLHQKGAMEKKTLKNIRGYFRRNETPNQKIDDLMQAAELKLAEKGTEPAAGAASGQSSDDDANESWVDQARTTNPTIFTSVDLDPGGDKKHEPVVRGVPKALIFRLTHDDVLRLWSDFGMSEQASVDDFQVFLRSLFDRTNLEKESIDLICNWKRKKARVVRRPGPTGGFVCMLGHKALDQFSCVVKECRSPVVFKNYD